MKIKLILFLVLLLLIVSPIKANNLTTFFVNETQKITLNVNAFDPDYDDTLIYSFSQPFDQNGTWIPGYEDAGEYVIDIGISDGQYSDSQQVNVIVFEKDRAPIIGAVPLQSINEKETLSLEIEAFDPDGDEVILSAISLPEGATFKNNILEWQPEYWHADKNLFVKILNYFGIDLIKGNGKFAAVINAKGKDLESQETIFINVIHVNRAPTIQNIPDITIKEGETLSFEPIAEDVDNDKLKYSYAGFVTRNNYKTNYEDEGEYEVIVTASDGLLSDSTTLKVTVENVNRAPVMEKINQQKITENNTIEFKLFAEDADGDELFFYPSTNMPSGATFENNTFSWTPPYDIVSIEEELKEFNINFTVDDYAYGDTQQVDIFVEHINRQPIVNRFSPQSDITTLYVGDSMVFEVNATDPDGDELEYKWNFGLFDSNINSTIIKRVFMRPGTKKITAKVSDGSFVGSKTWEINVLPPPIEEQPAPQQEPQQTPQYIQFTV